MQLNYHGGIERLGSRQKPNFIPFLNLFMEPTIDEEKQCLRIFVNWIFFTPKLSIDPSIESKFCVMCVLRQPEMNRKWTKWYWTEFGSIHTAVFNVLPQEDLYM